MTYWFSPGQLRREYEQEGERKFIHNGKEYIRAGDYRRQMARYIDSIPFVILYFIMENFHVSPLWITIINSSLFALSYIFFLAKYNHTPGHKMMKLKFINVGNGGLTFRRVLIRLFFYVISFPFILFFMIFRKKSDPFPPDKWSKTEVIQVKAGLGR